MQSIFSKAKIRTGVALIDKQHYKYFDIVSEVIGGLGYTDKSQGLFKELEEYVVYHFKTEEDLMNRYNYPDTARHVKQHDYFREKVKGLTTAGELGVDDKIHISSLLLDWFVNHIRNVDKKLCVFIKAEASKGSGVDAVLKSLLAVFSSKYGKKDKHDLGGERIGIDSHLMFPAALLEKFCVDVFGKFGFSSEESKIIADVLLLSDLYGIESHGMQRLVRYHKGIEKGLIKVGAKPEVVFETPVSAVVEGHDGMGQLLGHYAMNLAVDKARSSGVGIVSVRNSNHFGIAGYYAKMACDQGLIGWATTNSEAIMVPTHGRLAMIGSNPIALAIPAEPYDFLFDASTTVVTRGKLEMYNKMGKTLPEGWALDKDGNDSTDAADVLENIIAKNGGGIMPLGGSQELTGGHKGYGFGMMCELFSSILSQGPTSNYAMTGGRGNICHGFMAINPACFGEPEAIKRHLSRYLEELRQSPKKAGHERIYTHGEKEILAMEQRRKDGIPILVNTLREMADMADFVGIDYKTYFGDVKFDESPEMFKNNY